jgi:hypothetical protein
MKNNNSLGLGTILALIFIVLKLCGVIAWSWWWVLAPVWIPVSLIILLLVINAILK